MIAASSSGTKFPSVKAVRNYLLPGIWSMFDAMGKEAELICNESGGIDLSVNGKVYPFYSAADLEEPLWMNEFTPRVEEILREESVPVTIDYIANRIIPVARAYFPDSIISIDKYVDSIMIQIGYRQPVTLMDRKMLDDGGWHEPNLTNRLLELKGANHG